MKMDAWGLCQKVASWLQSRYGKLYQLQQKGLQQVLLIAVIALLAVGIDSSHPLAVAADLPASIRSLSMPQQLAAPRVEGKLQPAEAIQAAEIASRDEISYLDFDAAIAKGLSHRELTRPILTGSLMTRSHLLTGKAHSQH